MNYITQDLPKKGDTVIVGLSGGVDSTLTALLLKEKGCNVIGVTMSLWDGAYNPVFKDSKKTNLKLGCYSPSEIKNIQDCKDFCKKHDIEYHVIDVKKEYQAFVMDYFKKEYRSGRTPNPCVKCNETIKFGSLLDGVEKLNIQYDYFCTGHYAKIVRPEEGLFGTNEKPCMIATALDITKDQTYFINRVKSSVLEKVRFPLSDITKEEVYALAQKIKLEAANREESQDFIGQEYFEMIFSDKESIPGDIVDLDGNVLGRHKGIEHYTIGQRRGLGVAVSYPVYVQAIDAKNNIVVLAPNDALNANYLIADDFIWPGNIEPNGKIKAMVKIRLASKPCPAEIEEYIPSKEDDSNYIGKPWKITFESPQRAIAPGQAVVLYSDNVIIGGGIINKAL